jgi:hypothetical protein
MGLNHDSWHNNFFLYDMLFEFWFKYIKNQYLAEYVIKLGR